MTYETLINEPATRVPGSHDLVHGAESSTSANTTKLDFPFGKSTSDALQPVDSVDQFAQQIGRLQCDSVQSHLKIAAVMYQAKAALDGESRARLAEQTGFSLATQSKYLKIHSQRVRFEPLIDQLPAAWTVLYILACLTDAEFSKLVKTGKLRPDLTAELIKSHLTGPQVQFETMTAPTSEDDPRETTDGPQVMAEPSFRLFATIKVPSDKSADEVNELKKVIADALHGQATRIDFVERLAEAQKLARSKASLDLRSKLASKLASYYDNRNTMARADYEVLENAAWQHQHKARKGSYPYPAEDRRSIERNDHVYSLRHLKDRRAFTKFLVEKKLITPFSPVEAYAELGEIRCIRLALECCEAASSASRKTARQTLEAIAESDSPDSAHAKAHRSTLSEAGVL